LLSDRHRKAVTGLEEMMVEFQAFDQEVNEDDRKEWEEQERLAKELGGAHLKVYQVKMDQGQSRRFLCGNFAKTE
jgi:hypothetical protein